jgi:hypothetical protein
VHQQRNFDMNTTGIPRLAALTLSLGLMSGVALAADDGRDNDRYHRDRGHHDQQNTNEDQGERGQDQQQPTYHPNDRRTGRDRSAPPAAAPGAPTYGKPQDSDRNDRTNDQSSDSDRRYDRDRRGDRDNDRDRWRDRGGYGHYDQRRDSRRSDWSRFRRNLQSPHRFRFGIYQAPRGYYYRRWHFGERLPPAYFVRDYWLTNYFVFGLFAPPSPDLVWVRYGPDALLIDRYTGEIVQVRYNVFY